MQRTRSRFIAVFLILVILAAIIPAAAGADRIPEKKKWNYIGAMRVCWVKEWVSLREKPKKTSEQLAKIPLGDIVYSCIDIQNPRFYQCTYKGQTGYVLKKYLRRAPEFEPPESWALSKVMTMDEITAIGEVFLDWDEYNMHIVAAHGMEEENKKTYEILRIGCFLNGEPLWGHEEKVENSGQYNLLTAFIGGVEDDRQVMLFDGGYGLSMLDLLNGREKWTVTVADCPMGNGAAIAVDEEGTIYIAGSDGPDPVAVDAEGEVKFQSEVGDPEIYNPFEMTVENELLLVKYACGLTDGYKMVTFSPEGEILSIESPYTE